jgi:hypothetical protein
MEPAPPHSLRLLWLNRLLAVTVLLSAWLLFQVQPMVAKRILPWFGGGTAVWTITMLFFQTALFGGYLYAHLSVRWLSPRRQAASHAALLALAAGLLAAVGIVPSDAWKPAGSDFPTLRIMAMLAAYVGLPFAMLSATAPLAQAWFARANPGVTPYRLYALSNAGSLAALISYPLAVEPNLGVTRQGAAWSAIFVGFAALCGGSGLLSLGVARESLEANPSPDAAPPATRPARSQFAFWLALPACASVVLLAVTNHLCQDVASVPLLWIAPMIAYLATFILSFESDRWNRRWFWFPAAAAASFAACFQWHYPELLSFSWAVAVHLALVLGIGMACHGELARLRPAASQLTAYYLCIAAGGALGGLLAVVAAPALFSDFYELPLGVAAAWLLAMALLAGDRESLLYDGKAFLRLLAVFALFVVLVTAMVALAIRKNSYAVAFDRSFYGVLRVKEFSSDEPDRAYYTLMNGRISHGSQFLAPEHRRIATRYYQVASGVGQVLLMKPAPRRVGIVGLGAGTLAAYAEEGDEFSFYEINPQVIEFAEEYFTYLADARRRGAKITVIEGDARLSLERDPPQRFDVLALDAFSGDAVPAHLLTVEAFEQYLRHLKDPDGVLALHVSNNYLDLPLVVAAATERHRLATILVESPSDDDSLGAMSSWVLAHRQPDFFSRQRFLHTTTDDITRGMPAVAWTDDYSNLVGIIRRD